MKIAFSNEAIKDLRRLSSTVKQLVLAKIRQYAADPASLAGNVKTLRGIAGFRLRVQDWRILFTRDGDTMRITRIRHRNEAYD